MLCCHQPSIGHIGRVSDEAEPVSLKSGNVGVRSSCPSWRDRIDLITAVVAGCH